MSFRLAIGNCSCRNTELTGISHQICQEIDETLKLFKENTLDDIEKYLFKAKESSSRPGIFISTYLENLHEKRKLIVVQAQFSTFFCPNFISFRFVGKMFSEGIIINKDGEWVHADDKYLWGYR